MNTHLTRSINRATYTKNRETTLGGRVVKFDHPRAAVSVATAAEPLREAKVFDAEVLTIDRAVKRATKGPAVRTVIFSDSQAAVMSVDHRAVDGSQREFLL